MTVTVYERIEIVNRIMGQNSYVVMSDTDQQLLYRKYFGGSYRILTKDSATSYGS